MASLEVLRAAIVQADAELRQQYRPAFAVNYDLDRTLVSYQAGKSEAVYRWYPYREGFAPALVRYVLRELGVSAGRILDPFAGSGTALFVAADHGLHAVGIELLPSSLEILTVRNLIRQEESGQLAQEVQRFAQARVWNSPGPFVPFPHVRITRGAFPPEAEHVLGRYTHEVQQVEHATVRRILRFAALCVLEAISYTRKDGQYLRWDWRSGRRAGRKPFYKGHVRDFTEAVTEKLHQIAHDLSGEGFLFKSPVMSTGTARIMPGSCLDVLPTLATAGFDAIMTSPPYCNRYDYTRTYALELAYLGVAEKEIRTLRQDMLSCTVENREKSRLEEGSDPVLFKAAMRVFESHHLLQLILDYLDECRAQRVINNTGIPRMVRNYFAEMALVLFECARLLRPDAPLVMVNDDVRYQGVNIAVDLILSDFAAQAGFRVDKIWVLPRGKGNSSQQMAAYGREELRKCVYVWCRN
jgi:hypothetical protein